MAEDGPPETGPENRRAYLSRQAIRGLELDDSFAPFVRRLAGKYPSLPILVQAADRRRRLLRALGAFRERLRSLAGSEKYTQKWVGQQIGSGQPSMSRLEQGQADPKLSTLERYAAALGYNFFWGLLDMNGTPASEEFTWEADVHARASSPNLVMGALGLDASETDRAEIDLPIDEVYEGLRQGAWEPHVVESLLPDVVSAHLIDDAHVWLARHAGPGSRTGSPAEVVALTNAHLAWRTEEGEARIVFVELGDGATMVRSERRGEVQAPDLAAVMRLLFQLKDEKPQPVASHEPLVVDQEA